MLESVNIESKLSDCRLYICSNCHVAKYFIRDSVLLKF
jgi:formate-dependent nitrite reductase cytochrome c552 subunit